MKRSLVAVLCAAAAPSLVLSGCCGGDKSGSSSGPIALTMAGWSLSTTPEFKTPADGFHLTVLLGPTPGLVRPA